MDTISFDELLLKTAFCCMASDGNIDSREVTLIESMCDKSPLFQDFNFHEEINTLVSQINSQGKAFISEYFNLLKKATLTEQEELTLIDFAINTIKADELIEYSEIKFFKVIRHHLKVSDEKILDSFPNVEDFLEEDIATDSYAEKIKNQFIELVDLPVFEAVSQLNTIVSKSYNDND